jgi:hypothetical protein
MSCRELEKLFVAGAPLTQAAAHRRTCPQCEALARDVERVEGLTHGLAAPTWSRNLRQSLLAIPTMTVSCEGAALLLAERAEGEIRAADAKRLEGHLSRCEGCTEAAAVLDSAKELVAPPTPPWLNTRLVAARPEQKKRTGWRVLLSGKAFIAYAYAAAVAVMLLGWNPTAVVRTPGFAKLGTTASQAVTVARSSIGDRLGALNERAARTLAVWRGHIGGYGRAAAANAFSMVLRPEPKKTPAKPRLGREKGGATGADGFATAGNIGREPFPARFRV